MTSQRLAFLLMLMVAAGACGAESKPESRPERAPIEIRARIEGGELHVPFDSAWLPIPCVESEDGSIETTLVSPGPGSLASFVPLAISDDRTTPAFDLTILPVGGGNPVRHEGVFQMLPASGINSASVLPMLIHPSTFPLDHDAGSTVVLVLKPRVPVTGRLTILSPKASKPAPKPRPPDIILLCADALRYDHSLSGRGPELMPNLQEIMREGVVYDHAYTAGTWTLPSMSSVLTGMWPLEHAAGKRPKGGVAPGQFAGRFPPVLKTFPEIMRETGYLTIFLFSNSVVDISGMRREGFDLSVNCTYQRAGEMHARLAEILRAAPPDVPLLVVIHYLEVHHYKQWIFARNAKRASPYANPQGVVEAYDQSVREMDGALGEFRRTWSASRDLDSSLFVLFADHGEHLVDPGYEKLLAGGRPGGFGMSAIPVFNHGSSVDDELVRVPLVVRAPASGHWPAGRVEVPVSLVDLFPTVLAEAGIEREAPGNGGRILPRGAQAAEDPPRIFFTDYQLNGDELSSVREGPFKLVINHTTGKRSLRDLRLPRGAEGEPGQVARQPEVEERLFNAWKAYEERARRLNASRPPMVIETNEDVARDLRKMGYL